MKRPGTLSSCGVIVAVAALAARAASAQLIVTTTDGRTFTVPVKRSEVKSIEYADEQRQPSWRLVSTVEIQPPKIPANPEYQHAFACNSAACTTSAQFRDSTYLRVKHWWTAPPRTLAPGQLIPMEYGAQILEKRDGPGGFSSETSARLVVNGVPGPQVDGLQLGSAQASGTLVQRKGETMRAPAAGRKGDTFEVQVLILTSWAGSTWSFKYEWLD